MRSAVTTASIPRHPPRNHRHPHDPPRNHQHPHHPPRNHQHPHHPPRNHQHPHHPPRNHQHPHHPPRNHGVPLTFRTADPYRIFTERTGSIASEIQEVLTWVPGGSGPDGGRDVTS